MFQFIKTLVMIELLLMSGMAAYWFALAKPYRYVVSAKIVILLMLTPAVALLQHNALIFYAYLVVAVAFSSSSRAELCSVYLTLLPMTPLLAQETQAGGLYLLPLSAVSAMNLGALIGIIVRGSGRNLARPGYDFAAFLLFALFVYIDGRNVTVTSIARIIIIFLMAFGGPYLLMSRGLRSREDIDLALLRMGMSGTIAAIVAVFETVRHWVLFQSFNLSMHVPIPLQSATLALRGGRLRTGGPIVDYTVAGIFFATVLMTLPYLKSRFRGIFFWPLTAVLIAGLFATQSRGAWIAAAFGLLVVLLYRGQWVRAAVFGGGLVTLQILLGVIVGTKSGLAETLGMSGASSQTAEYRGDLLTLGLQQVYNHPLFGQTPKQLVANLSQLTQGQHIVDFVNSHLYVAMAAGIPLFLVWTMIWSLPAFGAIRYRRVTHPDGNLAELPLAIVAAVMVAIAFTSTVDRNLIWPTIALGMAGPCFALATQRGRRAPPAPRKPLVVMMPTERERPTTATG